MIITHIMRLRTTGTRFKAGNPGPVHGMEDRRQTLCGRRAQFRHIVLEVKSETEDLDSITCQRCRAAIKRGRAFSWRRR